VKEGRSLTARQQLQGFFALFKDSIEYDPLASIIERLAVDGLSTGAPAPQRQ